MRRWKRTLSIVMAVVVVFSLVTPRFGNARVEAASSDNLTGWRLGDTSAMTGNPTDGWQLDFSGNYYESNGTSYTANISVSKLQVKFNLSKLAAGKSIILQLGDKKSDFGQCTSTVMNFAIDRRTDGTAYFYILGLGEGNGQNAHTLNGFDFSKDHILEFVLENGGWLPALDGMVLSGDEAANACCSVFVQTMSEQFLEKTTVSFAPASGDATVLTVCNINFLEKPMDLTGWTQGDTTVMSGSPESDWQLDFYGAQFPNNGTSYEADIDVSKLQVSFNLSRLKNGKAFMLQLGDAKGSFGEGSDTRINFVFKKNDDGSLTFYGYDNARFKESGGLFLYQTVENFDSEIQNIAKGNYSKILYVRPYWTTMDGTRVEGLARYVHVEDGYKNLVSVPVNLMTDPLKREGIAAGALKVICNDPRFEFYDVQSVENGRIFANMDYHVVNGNTVKIVGNVTGIGQTATADGIFANVRFRLKDGESYTCGKGEFLNFTVAGEDFRNWDEKSVPVDVWDVRH